MSRLTRGSCCRFPVRGCHPLRRAFPDASGTIKPCHWPGPLSLATTHGVSLMSFPPATEMFQFTGFASLPYVFRSSYHSMWWVSPFGDPRIKDYWRLPMAYRSLSRPSSPLSAKASTKCPYALDSHSVDHQRSEAALLSVPYSVSSIQNFLEVEAQRLHPKDFLNTEY